VFLRTNYQHPILGSSSSFVCCALPLNFFLETKCNKISNKLETNKTATNAPAKVVIENKANAEDNKKISERWSDLEAQRVMQRIEALFTMSKRTADSVILKPRNEIAKGHLKISKPKKASNILQAYLEQHEHKIRLLAWIVISSSHCL